MKFETPKGWKLVPLSDVAEVQTGLAKGKALNGEVFELPYLRVANVQDNYLDLREIKKISVSPKDARRFSLVPGDVLFTEGGDFDKLGRGTVWRGEIPNCLHQNHIFAVRPLLTKLLPDFLAAVASSAHGRRYFQLSSKQSTNLASINSTQLKKFPVPIAPLRQQHKIVRILRTWDEATEQLADLIKLKRAQVESVSRQFFDSCHADGQNELEGWTEFELGDLFAERAENGASGETLLSITMAEGIIDRKNVGRKDTSTKDKTRYKRIFPGDIGYNTMRMWQGVSGLSKLSGIVSPAYTIVTPRASLIDKNYAALLFKSKRMSFTFQRYSQGLTSDTWNLKYPAFSKIKIRIPSMYVQRQHAKFLNVMLEEISLLEKQKRQFSAQKHGLMQRLLTGKWRVNTEGKDD